jgi:hypothetical protein
MNLNRLTTERIESCPAFLYSSGVFFKMLYNYFSSAIFVVFAAVLVPIIVCFLCLVA